MGSEQKPEIVRVDPVYSRIFYSDGRAAYDKDGITAMQDEVERVIKDVDKIDYIELRPWGKVNLTDEEKAIARRVVRRALGVKGSAVRQIKLDNPNKVLKVPGGSKDNIYDLHDGFFLHEIALPEGEAKVWLLSKLADLSGETSIVYNNLSSRE